MVISARWSLATGPVIMLGGVFVATAALSLLWEKYSKPESQPPKNPK
ncbi:unnamed protein product [Calypogeia fissa]